MSLSFSGNAPHDALHLRETRGLGLQMFDFTRQKTIKLDTAPQRIHVDGRHVQHVIANELGGIIDGLEQQRIAERLDEAARIKGKPGRRQRPQALGDEIACRAKVINDIQAARPQQHLDGVPMPRFDIAVSNVFQHFIFLRDNRPLLLAMEAWASQRSSPRAALAEKETPRFTASPFSTSTKPRIA